MEAITVIGAGLAGSQAALAAANLGVKVRLFEMRPKRMTPAHRSSSASELVCSNSFGGEGANNAKGLLQAEMRIAQAPIMQAADANRIPAGAALAVERDGFSMGQLWADGSQGCVTAVRAAARAAGRCRKRASRLWLARPSAPR